MPQHKAAYDAAIQQLTGPGAPFETVRRLIGGVDYTVYARAPTNLAALYRDAAQHGERESLCYEDERITFSQLFAEAAQFARALREDYGISAAWVE